MNTIISKQVLIHRQQPSKIRMGVILICLILLSSVAAGYDFSDARNSLTRDLMSSSQADSDGRLAIVYDVENRSAVKNQFDLVQLKKDLAYEMVKSFQVTDPVIVQEIMETNNLTFDQLLDDRSMLKQFTNRADCSQVLFVKLRPMDGRMTVDMKLVVSGGQEISRINMELAPESKRRSRPRPGSNGSGSSSSGRSFFGSLNWDFVPSYFPEGHNDSWFYFTPTALLIPDIQSIDLTLWLRNLREVDLRPMRFRYDLRLLKVLQLGMQAYAISEKRSTDTVPNLTSEQGLHSTYVSLKYQLADDSRLPVSIMLGIRRRIFWDTDNTDYRTSDDVNAVTDPNAYDEAKELDEANDQFNQLTLTAAVTGKLEGLGLMYNFYLDNQAFGTGAKFLLTSDFKLMADSVFYYYENAQIPNDVAVGIELHSDIGLTTLVYQSETEQLQLGLVFDF